jgi:hypothetical protein
LEDLFQGDNKASISISGGVEKWRVFQSESSAARVCLSPKHARLESSSMGTSVQQLNVPLVVYIGMCRTSYFWWSVHQLLLRCCSLQWTNFCISAKWLASGDGYLSCCPDAAVCTELISLCQCKVASGDGCLSCFPGAVVWTEPISLSQCKLNSVHPEHDATLTTWIFSINVMRGG